MTSRGRARDRAIAQDVELAGALPLDSLAALLRAHQYAQSTRRPAWDFAVHFDELTAAGLTPCDLRWLTCRGYIKHRRGASQALHPKRMIDHSAKASFSRDSAFILLPSGIRLAKLLLGESSASPAHFTARTAAGEGKIPTHVARVPVWDGPRRELRVGQVVIKRYCVPAENQEAILAAFEEESWPVHIDDPLAPVPGIDPKRRLHSTIQCLNRNQQVQLVHFRGDGYGRGVRWELLTA